MEDNIFYTLEAAIVAAGLAWLLENWGWVPPQYVNIVGIGMFVFFMFTGIHHRYTGPIIKWLIKSAAIIALFICIIWLVAEWLQSK